MSTENLKDFVGRGWAEHPKRARELAAELSGMAPGLPADADGAAAIGLAEHVWVSHLHDVPGFEAFVAALPPAHDEGAETAAMLRRARWLIAKLAGQEAPPPPDAQRWRAMQNLWSEWVARGRAAEVLRSLETERPAALAHPEPAARKALAAATYALALELREGRRGDPERDALMLALSRASRELWVTAGTWVQVERGDYELARCHAVLGEGAAALAHARACLARIQEHAGEPEASAFETFFAHEALAWAHRAAGDAAAEVAELARMRQLMAEVGDESLQPWCREALDALQH